MVLGVVVWEGDHVVEGLVGGQEGGPVEGRVVDPVVDREEADEALDRGFLQASQEASRKEEHLNATQRLNAAQLTHVYTFKLNIHANLVGVQEVGRRVDLEASLEEPGADPEVEARSSAGPAGVEAPAVPQAQQEEAYAGWA